MCSKAEKAVSWAISIANDNAHGYSQATRWGPSFDCSSLVISAFKRVGIPLQSTYTGNMYSDFIANGFKDVTALVNRANGSGMKRGDVLLNHVAHTALYIGSGQIVHARSSEGTFDTVDNSGNEIRTQSYWNYPWDCVLRLEEDDDEDLSTPAEPGAEVIQTTAPRLLPGNYPLLTTAYKDVHREDVEALQTLLCLRDFPIEITGYYDIETYNKVLFAQKVYGIEEDGECGPDTWRCLISNGRY